MLKLGFLTITDCSFWNIFFPPRGGLGPKGCVGRTHMGMFCSEHCTGKLDFFTSHFHYNLYLKWIISIISYILSLWNLFETKIVANGALDLFKNLLYSSPENKFSITGELTAPGVKSLFILYYKIFDKNKIVSHGRKDGYSNLYVQICLKLQSCTNKGSNNSC